MKLCYIVRKEKKEGSTDQAIEKLKMYASKYDILQKQG